MSDPIPPYTMADLGREARREAPAAARNVRHIIAVLEDWLPATGLVLETSSGTGQHARAFAEHFPALTFQPSDPDPAALVSIAAWREGGPANLLPPLDLDTAAPGWGIEAADAVLSINMAHIAPWAATLGLLEGAARLLRPGAPLIFYGPWLAADIETAPSNLAFDESLRARDPAWGLRTLEALSAAAEPRGFALAERRTMPANNLMLRLVRRG
ncbi:DUF938 domain-containing protein [Sphingomicrobium astaxanthinifaciens]|uniref:DUF938 domain-containing protein n=1 Tax=Sphingomicrobium astaxanthinifaciens TaxID=1227949 RepID=UPI001FCAFAC7|nr:DUF938 domain-containing protein [Sphingomicrobium astaxanthinifaciens]MCJ7422081.1 class I SAM-dependent methyltransferase [Sphingomicrobium astaxanthinifaciens]